MAIKVVRRRSAVILAALLCSQVGCFWVTTKREGNKLRDDVDKLDQRVASTESTLDEKVEKLQKILDEATKLLRRNSADLGAEVATLSSEQAKLTGLITEARRFADQIQRDVNAKQVAMEDRLADLEERLAKLEQKASRIPPDELYRNGKAAYDSGKYDDAIKAFRMLVAAHPDHRLADDALYYRAEAYYRKRDYKAAIPAFQSVFEKYSKSEWADDSLFRAGESAEKLKWCTDARAYFGLLRQKFPRSKLSKRAKQKDRQLRQNARNKKKCKT